jgi:hypothetical protein
MIHRPDDRYIPEGSNFEVQNVWSFNLTHIIYFYYFFYHLNLNHITQGILNYGARGKQTVGRITKRSNQTRF